MIIVWHVEMFNRQTSCFQKWHHIICESQKQVEEHSFRGFFCLSENVFFFLAPSVPQRQKLVSSSRTLTNSCRIKCSCRSEGEKWLLRWDGRNLHGKCVIIHQVTSSRRHSIDFFFSRFSIFLFCKTPKLTLLIIFEVSAGLRSLPRGGSL